jgi:hypothetical protein
VGSSPAAPTIVVPGHSVFAGFPFVRQEVGMAAAGGEGLRRASDHRGRIIGRALVGVVDLGSRRSRDRPVEERILRLAHPLVEPRREIVEDGRVRWVVDDVSHLVGVEHEVVGLPDQRALCSPSRSAVMALVAACSECHPSSRLSARRTCSSRCATDS